MGDAPPGRQKRKRRPPSRASTWTIRYAITALVAVTLVGMVLVLALDHEDLRIGVGSVLFDGFMLVALVPLYRQHRLRPRDLGLRRTSPAQAVGLVVACVIGIGIVNAIWFQGVLSKPATSLGVTLHENAAAKIVTGFGLAVSAPIVEEIFFRGLLYRALRNRLRVIPAALVAGFVFGAVHGTTYPLDTLPPKMVFGVLACLLYEQTGSLYPSMALHGLIDGAAFEAAITGQIGIVYGIYVCLGLVLLSYAGFRRVKANRETRTGHVPTGNPPRSPTQVQV
jgi:membrane protease YdiL (CAAX protease family)